MNLNLCTSCVWLPFETTTADVKVDDASNLSAITEMRGNVDPADVENEVFLVEVVENKRKPFLPSYLHRKSFGAANRINEDTAIAETRDDATLVGRITADVDNGGREGDEDNNPPEFNETMPPQDEQKDAGSKNGAKEEELSPFMKGLCNALASVSEATVSLVSGNLMNVAEGKASKPEDELAVMPSNGAEDKALESEDGLAVMSSNGAEGKALGSSGSAKDKTAESTGEKAGVTAKGSWISRILQRPRPKLRSKSASVKQKAAAKKGALINVLSKILDVKVKKATKAGWNKNISGKRAITI
jgi:hypothetical protein